MLAEHVNWARIYASAAREMAHTNSPDPNRRLRIGYVSADFRDHAMAHFVEPILSAHDRANDDVFCYSSVVHPDDVTRRLKSYGHTWRAIGGISDEKVAAQIHSDSIDILVDLGGHTADSRLLVFAHKPAPIQITWLGYPNTSGLATMDYWITDGWLDPPGQTERFRTERLLRLPETFACYAPPRDAPPVNELPAEKNGFVTFVSFNNLIKLGEDVLELWSELLREIQSARLVIATQRLADGNGLGPFTERCRKAGMPMDRIRFLGGRQTVAYLKSHHEMDIALDSFPFAGHTITLHALWMGLPVVTLAGTSHVSRRGVSVMQNLGLPELIAQTPDDYVRIAKDLAADLDRLANLRATLRERMRAAPLTDAPRFAKNLSAAFRAIWTNWCESRG